MIVRVWRFEVDASRLNEFERFEANETLPVLVRQPGFQAVLFVSTGPNGVASISIWESRHALEVFMNSPSLQEFLKKLEASGLVRGPGSEEIFEVRGGFLPAGQAIPTDDQILRATG